MTLHIRRSEQEFPTDLTCSPDVGSLGGGGDGGSAGPAHLHPLPPRRGRGGTHRVDGGELAHICREREKAVSQGGRIAVTPQCLEENAANDGGGVRITEVGDVSPDSEGIN